MLESAPSTQADVTEFARALTGWSIVGLRENRFGQGGQPGEFTFRPGAHEPGARHILGKTYPDGGAEQARAVLHDLAANPTTGHHIAVKLARHFVADDPPPTLIARLERQPSTQAAASLWAGGRDPDRCAGVPGRPSSASSKTFRTQILYFSYRAAGVLPDRRIAPVLNSLGQQAFSAPSPKGWAEDAQTWASPDGLVKRMGWAEAFAARTTPPDAQPMQMAENTLGARLMPATATAISRAESRPEAVSILLMSPEFQRR